MIDQACQAGGAKAIVDIDGTDSIGAGIQHRQKCCQSVEGSPVSDTGRHRDHRAVRQSGYDAGQGSSMPAMAMMTFACIISSR